MILSSKIENIPTKYFNLEFFEILETEYVLIPFPLCLQSAETTIRFRFDRKELTIELVVNLGVFTI